MNFVYIVECRDGTLYTGWTTDLEKRITRHNRGDGAKYTKNRFPVALRYFETLSTKEEALKREYAIKHLSRQNKLALISAFTAKGREGKEMANMDMHQENFQLRFAEEKDISLILDFIRQLADYEKMLDKVTATEEILRESLFQKKAAEVVIGEYQGEAVAFALFFHNFSTFLGQAGIYLEDLYVKPDFRGRGIGKTIFSFLAKLALERNCGRLEWWCLDWNQPAIGFYRRLGAVPMDEWTVYRVAGGDLLALADERP